MKIFILDDLKERHDAFVLRYPGHRHRHAYTVAEAEVLLLEGGFDLAFLDHDLGDWYKLLTDSGEITVERTGLDVVRYLLEKVPRARWPKQVVVHTWNAPRGQLMTALLREQGVDVSYVPFTK